ncbi:unnamed protein product [Staurois parvus]|uniref:Secreted protein n=1 Tax=Staurois parvus TaxID=386267 RepID=A0ABN9HCB0_9NEOB|nr:unnamed protein product [Staurois parvus]
MTRVSGMDSPMVVGLTCLVGCSTKAGQRVLSAARISLLQSSHHLRLIAGDCRHSTGDDQRLRTQYRG